MGTHHPAPGPTGGFRTFADQLRSWSDEQVRTLLTARPDLLDPTPTSFSALAVRVSSRNSLTRALRHLTHAELDVLRAQEWGGAIHPHEAVLAGLIARGIVWRSTEGLRPLSEVATALTRATPVDEPSDADPALLDRVAIGAAFEMLHRVELLLDTWGTTPPAALKSGGLGSRDLKTAADLLHTDVETVTLVFALCVGCGLASLAIEDDGTAVWSATDAYADWLTRPPAPRWVALARRWLADGRAEGGDASRARLAELLGVTGPRAHGMGALSSFGRALVHGADPTPLVEPLFPQPIDHVLIQADLTAIAPGPLVHEIAVRLDEMTVVESRGGASVHRFTPDSVRRAFSLGWTAEDLHLFVEQVSTTPVPQPLSYLIDDTARLAEVVSTDAASGGCSTSRGTGRSSRAEGPSVETPETVDIPALIAALREVDSDGGTTSRSGHALSPGDVLAQLNDAVEGRHRVIVRHVDGAGHRAETLITPQRLRDGSLTAYDHRSGEFRTFSVHRITAVRPVRT